MFLSVESRAFPECLKADVEAVIPALSDLQLHPPSEAFTVVVQGEKLAIPYRVYYRESRVLKYAKRPGPQGQVALCLGTRHYDGFLRERCLTHLLTVEQPWVVPFVIQLIGEYVIQILQVVERALPRLNAQMYGEFLNANIAYQRTISRRAVSYWNEYYRRQYPAWREYPGYRVLLGLHAFAKRSNPSIEGTASSGLRPPPAAPHVKR